MSAEALAAKMREQFPDAKVYLGIPDVFSYGLCPTCRQPLGSITAIGGKDSFSALACSNCERIID